MTTSPDGNGPTSFPTEGQTTTPEVKNPEPADGEGTVDVDEVSTETGDLVSPCCTAQLPDGDMLIGAQDSGRVYRLDATRLDETAPVTPVGDLHSITLEDDRSLLALAVDSSSGGALTVYAYYNRSGEGRVGTYTYDEAQSAGDQLTPADESMIEELPATGGVLSFGHDDMLHVATGEEILRVEPDGDTPQDNPEMGSDVYASEFTNIVGLAFDPVGRLWVADAGDGTANDPASISMVEKDPLDGTVATLPDRWVADDPTIPTGLAYDKGSRSLWMTTADDAGIWRIPLDGKGGTVNVGELLPSDELTETGAIAVVPAPDDGTLRVLTADGRVLQLTVT